MDYLIALAKLRRFATSVEEKVPITITEKSRPYGSAVETNGYAATVAHFESGDMYLYDIGTNTGYHWLLKDGSRLRCKAFFVAKGETLAQRSPVYGMKWNLERIIGGEREEYVGRTRVRGRVYLNSAATKLQANVLLSWTLTDEDYRDEKKRAETDDSLDGYRGAYRQETISANDPNLLPIVRAFVSGDMTAEMFLLECLPDKAPQDFRVQKAVWDAIDYSRKLTEEQLKEAAELKAAEEAKAEAERKRREQEEADARVRSWKVGVMTSGDRDWCFNGLRFRTRDEAQNYGDDLACRWTAVRKWEVQPSDDEPNTDGRGSLKPQECAA